MRGAGTETNETLQTRKAKTRKSTGHVENNPKKLEEGRVPDKITKGRNVEG